MANKIESVISPNAIEEINELIAALKSVVKLQSQIIENQKIIYEQSRTIGQ